MRWLGFHPFFLCKIRCPSASRLQATFERELYPQLLHSLTFSSKMRYFFQHRQHSQMNLLMLLILRPSRESSLIPICTATFWRAKSALTSQMWNPFSSYSYSLKLETTSAIFFQQFLLVIHPSSSSDSLEDDETFLFGFTGTEIHSSSSSFSYFYSIGLVSLLSSTVFSSVFSAVSVICSSWSLSSEKSDKLLSWRYSSRSYLSRIGGGSLLSSLSRPYFLQTAQATAISSISTKESEAISPVFFANSLTSSTILSSGSTTYISKGRFQTNSLVFRSFNYPRTSLVVIRREVDASWVILVMEMKALASRMAIDLRGFCIVEQQANIRIL